jgi:hypothetical protein
MIEHAWYAWPMGFDVWHWWTLSAGLIILEMLLPGVFLLWVGIAAGLVAVLVSIMPTLAWDMQIFAFAIFSLGAIILQQAWISHHPIQSDSPTLNRRGASYIGRIFVLDAPIVNGIGKLNVDDTIWKVRGDDCAAGTKVVITGIDVTVLVVKCHVALPPENETVNLSPKL